MVITSHPLRNVLHKPDLSGRLVKWAVEISQFDISYLPRTSVQSQALADFISDFSSEGDPEIIREIFTIADESRSGLWILYTDGSTHSKGTT